MYRRKPSMRGDDAKGPLDKTCCGDDRFTRDGGSSVSGTRAATKAALDGAKGDLGVAAERDRHGRPVKQEVDKLRSDIILIVGAGLEEAT